MTETNGTAAGPRAVLDGLGVDAALIDELIDTYVHLHRHPELSAQEHETAAFIEARLDEIGIAHERIGGTGVVGLLRNGEGATIAFRADTDGLPIAENTGLPYASTATGTLPDGGGTVSVMHGCGHDTHITALLGAVEVLAQRKDLWKGTLVAIFQPGEETAYGAKAMVADGLWERMPRPSLVLGQHVMPGPTGTIMLRSGNMATLADSWRITVHGKQAHGSQPENSIDPVVLASSIVVRLQTIVSREVSPINSVVVTVGTFHAGLKENIIPAEAVLSVNVRTPDEETRTQVLASIRRIVAGEAIVAGAPEPSIEVLNTFPRLVNEETNTERLVQEFGVAFGEDRVIRVPLGMGSEDAGWLSDAIGVPGVFWAFGAFPEEAFAEGAAPAGNHSPEFAPDARMAVETGTAAALVALLSSFAAG